MAKGGADKKIIRGGRICIILKGRHAGKKAIVMNHSKKSFQMVHVVGVRKYPRKLTARTPANKIARKASVKTFVKRLNVSHVLPTRYLASSELLKALEPGHAAAVKAQRARRQLGRQAEGAEALKKTVKTQCNAMGQLLLADATKNSSFMIHPLKF